MTVLKQVVRLKEKGFDVIPCYAEGQYKKQPKIRIKNTPALSKRDLIEWYSNNPKDLVGIRTNNYFCIDVDTEEHASGVNGYDTFNKYIAPYASTPPALECLTPTGGMHLYYKKTAGYELKQLPATLKGVDIQAGVNNYSILYFKPEDELIIEPANEASLELLNKLVEYQDKSTAVSHQPKKYKNFNYNLSALTEINFHRVTKTGKLLKAIINKDVQHDKTVKYLNYLANKLAEVGINNNYIVSFLSIANNYFDLPEDELNNVAFKAKEIKELNYIGKALLNLIKPPFSAGERNTELFKTALRLFGYGLDSAEVWAWLNICNSSLSIPLATKEIANIFDSVSRYQ